jgi:BCD family chlorophyll transporter-like MFS transporter
MAARSWAWASGATTALTAMLAGGALLAFALAARWLGAARPVPPGRHGRAGGHRGLRAVIFAEPLDSPLLFRAAPA